MKTQNLMAYESEGRLCVLLGHIGHLWWKRYILVDLGEITKFKKGKDGYYHINDKLICGYSNYVVSVGWIGFRGFKLVGECTGCSDLAVGEELGFWSSKIDPLW